MFCSLYFAECIDVLPTYLYAADRWVIDYEYMGFYYIDINANDNSDGMAAFKGIPHIRVYFSNNIDYMDFTYNKDLT
jgi:hypothetical protein